MSKYEKWIIAGNPQKETCKETCRATIKYFSLVLVLRVGLRSQRFCFNFYGLNQEVNKKKIPHDEAILFTGHSIQHTRG